VQVLLHDASCLPGQSTEFFCGGVVRWQFMTNGSIYTGVQFERCSTVVYMLLPSSTAEMMLHWSLVHWSTGHWSVARRQEKCTPAAKLRRCRAANWVLIEPAMRTDSVEMTRKSRDASYRRLA